ncbi:MAG: HPr(Ser) kinase/phosphatase [Myxococcota bacterium]
MSEPTTVVSEIIDDASLGVELVLVGGKGGLERVVSSPRIQKSGLALVGHFYGIDSRRIQIFGATEVSFLGGQEPDVLDIAVNQFFALRPCAVVVTESRRLVEEFDTAIGVLTAAADETNTPLLLSAQRSSRTITALHALLDERLARRARLHGVLVDVFEVGMLILGSSGVGKSEVALDLVMRGHRLVADDVVDCHFRPPEMVFGEPADKLRHYLEVRGLGILNIKDLFGVTAIRDQKRIDVVVRLAEDASEGDYDRLGLEQRHHRILGVDVPELLIPVRPGRDMASILEVAARNELLKAAGHHPARHFISRVEGALLGSEHPSRAVPPSSTLPHVRRGRRRPPESSVGLAVRGSAAPTAASEGGEE